MKRLLMLLVIALLAVPALAQDDMMTPEVVVADQLSLDGTVTIERVVSEGPGWIVIHAASEEGTPGPVIGFRAVNDGVSNNVNVMVDAAAATPTLFAMLHTDTGEVGVYEFGTVEGADGPVAVDGNVVTPPFNVEMVRMYDQFVDMNTVTAAAVVTQQDGWLVVHAAGEGGPGPVIGFAPVSAGTNTDVTVELDESGLTDTLFPMLHVDTGEAGTYEFGTVEGADGPVVFDGQVATFPITAGTPAMRVRDQIVTDSVTAESVLIDSPGWLVIHADNGEGAPGPVIGFAPVEEGTNTDVMVEIDAEAATPVLFPMLHYDTGEVGTYEFGEVEGADGPVRVGENVLVFPINAAPSITYNGVLEGNTLRVEQAMIDAQGWLVIHADNEGAPGPVLGAAPLVAGVNGGITVELDEAGMTDTLFPMLHYDTGEAGVYEFGMVEGADGPVAVNGNVVVGPLMPIMPR